MYETGGEDESQNLTAFRCHDFKNRNRDETIADRVSVLCWNPHAKSSSVRSEKYAKTSPQFVIPGSNVDINFDGNYRQLHMGKLCFVLIPQREIWGREPTYVIVMAAR